MAHGRNKYQSREQRKLVREVLLKEWDPIGINMLPDFQDEYDAYVGSVYLMLVEQDASSKDISDYLFEIATAHMGMSATDLQERCVRTADSLISMRPRFTSH